jgi:hypothetical protein
VQTLTDATGSFKLDNVPVGGNVPLVIQMGRWRRQVVLPTVAGCTSTAIDAVSTSLPGKRADGDIPRIAIVTGHADPMECLLLKIGIDPSEIQESADAAARIHFYQGVNNPGLIMSNGTPSGTALYGDATSLAKYDVVMLPCEGAEYNQGGQNRGRISAYLDAGGRVFSTHYSYDWWHYTASPFEAVGTWRPKLGDEYSSTIIASLNTSFPKGMAFAQWLIAAGVTDSPMGQLAIREGRHDLVDTKMSMDSQDWVNYSFQAAATKEGVMQMTFNTPLNAPVDPATNQKAYCGRAVFSDYHVSFDALVTPPTKDTGSTGNFPSNCKSNGLSDQEKALAFQLFDLSSCVQSDDEPPIS